MKNDIVTQYGSFAHGAYTTASGQASHAEGVGTVANHLAQNVSGMYNIPDPASTTDDQRGTYIEIVGNGTASTLSNARTLDWEGNEKISGNLTINAGSANEVTITPELLNNAGGSNSGGGSALKYVKDIPGYTQTTIETITWDIDPNADLDSDEIYEAYHTVLNWDQEKLRNFINTWCTDEREYDFYSVIPLYLEQNGSLIQFWIMANKEYSGMQFLDTKFNRTLLDFNYNTDHVETSGQFIYQIGAISTRIKQIEINLSGQNNAVIINDTINNIASGSYSVAEGKQTIASGPVSHAEGKQTTASGDYSHAEGYQTIASAYQSHAEGNGTTASGQNAHAEGSGTAAEGNSSHAEGGGTIASEDCSHAEGGNTTAGGLNSHAEGAGTTARGSNSHAEGLGTTTSGLASHAEGEGTTASKQSAHAEGYYTSAFGNNSHAEGNYTTASGNDSHAEGTNTTASGISSHTEGNQTIASAYYAHAEGGATTASGSNSHAEGSGTAAEGNSSHAEGGGTIAHGYYSHAEGDHATASGQSAHAEGYRTTASAYASHAEGYYTIANHLAQHVFGQYNIKDSVATERGTYIEIVGNGSTTAALSNARTLDWAGNEQIAGNLTLGMGTTAQVTITPQQLTALLAMIQ